MNYDVMSGFIDAVITVITDRFSCKLEELLEHSFSDKNSADSSKPLSTKEAAEFLGINIKTIYSNVHEQKIPFHKRNGKLYFFSDELINWVKSGKQNQKLIYKSGGTSTLNQLHKLSRIKI
jgi:excisionase family DNA binding protein